MKLSDATQSITQCQDECIIMMTLHRKNHHDVMIFWGGGGLFKSKSTYSEASHPPNQQNFKTVTNFQEKSVYEELDHFVIMYVGVFFCLVNCINN